MTLGIITACYKADYFMVKATCASIRYYLPEVPICVIVDGDFSITEIEELYNVQTLHTSEFKHSILREICPGSPRTKLASIWESPFDEFLCIDSDIVFWGNVLSKINLKLYDFVILSNLLSSIKDKENIKQFFFDTDKLNNIDPDFQWLNRPFFCAGAFAAKKDCLDLDTYIRLEEFSRKNPGTFNFAEQGIFNYMVLKAADQNTLSISVADLQYIVVDHSKEKSRKRFFSPSMFPPKNIK
ncbi:MULTISPECIES: hypothetical protein [unclassified Moorena]|uniref:hypothetical protein n=1 Tax=unclassified Moorena TaxID=2683338 RepID=UPI0013C9350F|nr:MULTISPECIES: hypothetical protein [unclassified Moorena]NEP31273.1 hypothetical protein [Moorena sp. SIO3B2]NES40578.1 hypothetical protein [Moorena sp. SIO2C4]